MSLLKTSLSSALLLTVFLLPLASCDRFSIEVGSRGAPDFVFNPQAVTAKAGETLDFHFIDENAAASVVRSTADKPCTPMPDTQAGSFNSGFVLGEATGANVFSVQVSDTKPMYVSCAVGAHCAAGMVMIVNPATGTDLQKYMTAAKGVKSPPPMTAPSGGTFNNPGIPGTGPISITFLNPLVAGSIGHLKAKKFEA